ncbi:CLUMA_CG020335, isoform A [Clunio marinus]|uniref:CLUMA_CG020335, isoform A n=1 Tax=Clunio marinus TaxID=568069 RepID=A0A1J1J4M0_9DIPT|nr:CLUMA_CG020335, isoform A [Clunio marinus]
MPLGHGILISDSVWLILRFLYSDGFMKKGNDDFRREQTMSYPSVNALLGHAVISFNLKPKTMKRALKHQEINLIK